MVEADVLRTVVNRAKALKIVTLSKVVEVRINESTMAKKRVYDSVNVQLIKIVSSALGFQYELTFANDGEMGRLLPDGNWTGVIGLVHREEVDMAISTVALTEERCSVIPCSYPYECIRLTFATKNPEYSADILGFVRPFSYSVWVLMICLLAVIPFYLYVVFNQAYPIQRLILCTLGACVRQPMYVKPQRLSEYVALLSWTAGTMFLSYSYTAVLLSFMTFPTMTGIRTIPELGSANQIGTHECFTVPGAFFGKALSISYDSSSRIIGEDLLRHEGTRDVEELLGNESRPKIPVFISGTDMLAYFKRRYFVSKDTFFPIFLTIPMRKGFCCKEKLNKILSHIVEGGLFQKIVNDNDYVNEMKNHIHSTREEVKERKLSVFDFEGEFIFLIGGLTLSCIVFLMELVFGKLGTCIKRLGEYFGETSTF